MAVARRPYMTEAPNNMPKGTAPKKDGYQDAPPPFSEDWFDRTLAELNAGLAELEASLASRRSVESKPELPHKRTKPRIKKLSTHSPSTVAAPAGSVAVPAPADPPAPPVQQPHAPPSPSAIPLQPTGTDLADPKNFGLMPPMADLDQGTASPEEYRNRLARHVAFANKVLHTSRVPAAVWREWRVFEKAAHGRLRELTTRPVEAVEQD